MDSEAALKASEAAENGFRSISAADTAAGAPASGSSSTAPPVTAAQAPGVTVYAQCARCDAAVDTATGASAVAAIIKPRAKSVSWTACEDNLLAEWQQKLGNRCASVAFRVLQPGHGACCRL